MTEQAQIPVSPRIRADRLRKLADHIENLPNDQIFDMSSWFYGYDEETECESPSCIAGHAVALFVPNYSKELDARYKERCEPRAPARLAQEVLGLSRNQAEILFLPECSDFVTEADAVRALRTLAENPELGKDPSTDEAEIYPEAFRNFESCPYLNPQQGE